jgi:hypothetical protein
VWIAHEAVTPRIAKAFDTFKLFWATKITLVNQTAIPASMHSYGMTIVNNNNSVILYGESIATLGPRTLPRVSEDSGLNNCIDAGPTTGHATVLHGATAAAPPWPPMGCNSNSATNADHHVALFKAVVADKQPRRTRSRRRRANI